MRGEWAVRRVVLAGSAPAVDVAFQGKAAHVFHSRQSSEGPFQGGSAPVALPGRDGFLVTVPPREGELTLVDFATKAVTRLGAEGDAVVVSARGDAVIVEPPGYGAAMSLVSLNDKSRVGLRGCHNEAAWGAAAFAADGSLWATLFNGTQFTMSAQRFDATGKPQCGVAVHVDRISALAASAHALFVLDIAGSLQAYDASTGAHVASLEFGEQWMAARFDDGGAIELTGNASEAAAALWCKANDAAVWSPCPTSAMSTPRRLLPLLAP